jgi:V/A-type H+-transporting ATPase subunit D
MEEIHTTRSELLARRLQISLAEQGRDLLKKKQDALLVEFMKVIDRVMDIEEKMRQSVAEAKYALVVAKAVDGSISLKSAAMASQGEILIDISGSKIMGISVPEIPERKVARSVLARGYSITSVSSRIDQVAEKFEVLVNLLIAMAGVETKLRRLGVEIQKTRRRVNALEQVVIPRLKEQVRFIQMALDERARQDLFRLKKVKKALESKKFQESNQEAMVM